MLLGNRVFASLREIPAVSRQDAKFAKTAVVSCYGGFFSAAVAVQSNQLDGVRDNRVYLSFGAGCHGCGIVDLTLKQGGEARIKELIPRGESSLPDS